MIYRKLTLLLPVNMKKIIFLCLMTFVGCTDTQLLTDRNRHNPEIGTLSSSSYEYNGYSKSECISGGPLVIAAPHNSTLGFYRLVFEEPGRRPLMTTNAYCMRRDYYDWITSIFHVNDMYRLVQALNIYYCHKNTSVQHILEHNNPKFLLKFENHNFERICSFPPLLVHCILPYFIHLNCNYISVLKKDEVEKYRSKHKDVVTVNENKIKIK
jgi:hypothetical protein